MFLLRDNAKRLIELFVPGLRKPAKSLYIAIWSRYYSDSLVHLANIYGTGKSTTQPYAEVYQHHFCSRRRLALNILEIGVGGYADPHQGGNSLRMWKRYFPKSHLYGIDIEDKRHLSQKRITILKGDQTDSALLGSLVKKVRNFDIIIDDGSHVNEHVLKTFEALFPALSENGIYVIEDTQTSYWPKYGGDSDLLNKSTTIMGYFKALADSLNYEEIISEAFQPSPHAKHIRSIHFYHNLIFIYRGRNEDGSNYALKHRA